MSCCRAPSPLLRSRSRTVAVCSSCQMSLREPVASELQRVSQERRVRGTHRVTVAIVCPRCSFTNRVPLVWTRR